MSDPNTALTLTSPEAVALYLAELGAEESLVDNQTKHELDPSKLFPVIKLPREGTALSITINGEALPAYTSRKFFDLTIIGLSGARALFPPDGAEGNTKLPACSTGLQPTGDLRADLTYGMRRNEDGTEEAVPCRGCEWNRFDSLRLWDPTKQGRAKACGERRLLGGLVMTRGPQLPIADEDVQLYLYDYNQVPDLIDREHNPLGVVMLRYSLGSNAKLLASMEEVARSRNVPVSRCVWRFGVEEQEKGARKWTSFTVRLVGFISPASKKSGILLQGEQWWLDYVSRYGRSVEALHESGSATSESEKGDEEIPF